jgi:predicted amidohydrolase
VPGSSAIARIAWVGADGKPVPADPPPGQEKEKGHIPIAEPEHPLDGETKDGWTAVWGLYRAPSKAARAIVELHLQWAPKGRVEWAGVSFTEAKAPPPRKVRLAAIHHAPAGPSPEANREGYAPLIAEAARQRADLAVLGETINHVNVKKKPHEVAEAIPGPTTAYFARLAGRHELHIVVGLYEKAGIAVYNSAVLIGPDGKVIGTYRKVCLPHQEVELGVTPGDEYPVFKTRLGKVGMMVCYDGFHPEVARELAGRGAEVIAWPVAGCNPLLARARACENHVYIVSSAYCAAESGWMISGVIGHDGAPLAKASKPGTAAVAEVDLSERFFWRNNLGDYRSMAIRHRPPPAKETK